MEQKTVSSIVDPKILLDEMVNIRERGYATDNQEFMEGMAAIAVPIRDNQQRLLTTLSLHAPIQRHGLEELEKFGDLLVAAAKQLEAILE